MEKKNLYIIGNGFDLHHEINSSYFEYRKWLKTHHKDIYWELVNTFYIDDESPQSIELLEKREHPWWKDFENQLGDIDLAEIVDNCVFNNYPNFDSEEFRDRDYHAAEIDAEITLSKLVSDIKSTFEEWVKSLNAPNKIKKIKINDDNAFFITFNYTDTLETLYKIPNHVICHIHGKANNDEELIIGHNKTRKDLELMADNTPEPPSNLDGEELNEWYSNHGDFITDQTRDVAVAEFNNLQKDTTRIISENNALFKSLSEVEKVHIYGFSFSDVDKPYLEKLVASVPENVLWEISYYSDKEKEEFNQVMQTLKVKTGNISFVKLNDLID